MATESSAVVGVGSVADDVESVSEAEAIDDVEAGSIAVKDVAEEDDGLEPMEGRRAYMCVLGSFLVHFVVMGNTLSGGLYLPVYEEVYADENGDPADRSVVALTYQAEFALLFLSAIVVGPVSDKAGVTATMLVGLALWLSANLIGSFSNSIGVTIAASCVKGFSNAALYLPAVTTVPQWFDKRRGLALGLANLGAGVGQLVIGVGLERMLSQKGFRFSLRITSLYGGLLLLVAIALIKRRLPNARGPFDTSVLKERPFILMLCSALFFMAGYNVPLAHLAAYVEDLGFSSQSSGIALALIGAGSSVGRVLLGYVGDKVGRVRTFQGSLVATATVVSVPVDWHPLTSCCTFRLGFCTGSAH